MSENQVLKIDTFENKKNIFKNVDLKMPKTKPMISIRLDSDVLEWFRSQGAGYQTRINAVLRMYMEANEG